MARPSANACTALTATARSNTGARRRGAGQQPARGGEEPDGAGGRRGPLAPPAAGEPRYLETGPLYCRGQAQEPGPAAAFDPGHACCPP